MILDPSKTALVFIEFQNDFTSPGGTLHEAVRPVMESTHMLDHAVETVEKARDLGVTIIHTPISFTEDYHELSPSPTAFSKVSSIPTLFERAHGAPRSLTC